MHTCLLLCNDTTICNQGAYGIGRGRQFNCKGDNLRDTEWWTSYAFELRVKRHNQQQISDWWLLANYDSVKELSARACALCVFHCLWCFESKWDKSVTIDRNRKQISAGGCLMSGQWQYLEILFYSSKFSTNVYEFHFCSVYSRIVTVTKCPKITFHMATCLAEISLV